MGSRQIEEKLSVAIPGREEEKCLASGVEKRIPFCIPKALKGSRLFEQPPSPLQILPLSVLDSGPEHCHKRIKNTGLYTSALGFAPPSAGI